MSVCRWHSNYNQFEKVFSCWTIFNVKTIEFYVNSIDIVKVVFIVWVSIAFFIIRPCQIEKKNIKLYKMILHKFIIKKKKLIYLKFLISIQYNYIVINFLFYLNFYILFLLIFRIDGGIFIIYFCW